MTKKPISQIYFLESKDKTKTTIYARVGKDAKMDVQTVDEPIQSLAKQFALVAIHNEDGGFAINFNAVLSMADCQASADGKTINFLVMSETNTPPHKDLEFRTLEDFGIPAEGTAITFIDSFLLIVPVPLHIMAEVQDRVKRGPTPPGIKQKRTKPGRQPRNG